MQQASPSGRERDPFVQVANLLEPIVPGLAVYSKESLLRPPHTSTLDIAGNGFVVTFLDSSRIGPFTGFEYQMRSGRGFEPWKVTVDTNRAGQVYRIGVLDEETDKSAVVDAGRITFEKRSIVGGNKLTVSRRYKLTEQDEGKLVAVSAGFLGDNGSSVNRTYEIGPQGMVFAIIDTGSWNPESENPLDRLPRVLTETDPLLGQIPQTSPSYYEETLRILERAGMPDFAIDTRQYFRMVFADALHKDQMQRRANRLQ